MGTLELDRRNVRCVLSIYCRHAIHEETGCRLSKAFSQWYIFTFRILSTKFRYVSELSACDANHVRSRGRLLGCDKDSWLCYFLRFFLLYSRQCYFSRFFLQFCDTEEFIFNCRYSDLSEARMHSTLQVQENPSWSLELRNSNATCASLTAL